MNSRRNPAAARALLTTYPSKKPPRKQYKCLFYLIEFSIVKGLPPMLPPQERALDPWAWRSRRLLFDRIGRTGGKIHLCRRSSEGHGVVLSAFAGEVGGHREQPRSRKDLPGPVALIEGDPDRESAIGSEAPGDRDQAQRHATPLQPLLGRQDLVGAPEDEDQDRIRRAGQFHSFVLPSIRMLPPDSDYNARMTGYVPTFAPQVPWALMALIGGAALAVNIPLGYAREGFRRFSIGWFVCVHLSVPLIAWLRLENHVSAWGIPAFVACAVLGQIAGGKVRRIRRGRP